MHFSCISKKCPPNCAEDAKRELLLNKPMNNSDFQTINAPKGRKIIAAGGASATPVEYNP